MEAGILDICRASSYPAHRYDVRVNVWCRQDLYSRSDQGDSETLCTVGQRRHEYVAGNDRAPPYRFAQGFRT